MKKTLILGASTNEERYAYKAAHKLSERKHEIIPVGIKRGEVAGKEIVNNKEIFKDIDTITMYIGPKHQADWQDYILKTNPKRIVFNPGTENPELEAKAQARGIETIEACTLVMLTIGNY